MDPALAPARRRAAAVAAWALVALALLGTGCASTRARARGSEEVLRLGVFPNLTHAPAFVGLGASIFRQALGSTEIDLRVFSSGAEAGTAILSGSLDAAFIGPGPTAELYLRGRSVAVVSGAVGGGVSMVGRTGAGIAGPGDLRGKRVAVPAIANTQDVALRTWLHRHGLRARDEGGDVTVLPVEPAELVALFRSGQLDAAWAPAPWPQLLVEEGVGTILLDESALWPGGRFATTYLLVSTPYLEAHPAVVERLVRATVESLLLIRDEPARAIALARRELEQAGGPRLSPQVLTSAWGDLTFTWDPLAPSLATIARRAHDLGYLDEAPSDILRVYRLDTLNRILRGMDLPTVDLAP
jgi:NitT/TauT family transport system substrate-binding protein